MVGTPLFDGSSGNHAFIRFPWEPPDAIRCKAPWMSSSQQLATFEATVVVDLENSEEPMPIVTPTSAVSTTIYTSRLAEKIWSSWPGIHGIQLNFMAFIACVVSMACMEFVAWRLRWSCGLFRADTLCPLMQCRHHVHNRQGMLSKSMLLIQMFGWLMVSICFSQRTAAKFNVSLHLHITYIIYIIYINFIKAPLCEDFSI